MDALRLMICTLFAGNVYGGILYHKAALNQGHEYSLGSIVTPVKVIKVTNTVAVPVPYAVSVPKGIPIPVEVPKPFPYPVPHPVPVEIAKPIVVPHAISVIIRNPVPVPHAVPVPQPVPVPVGTSLNSVPIPFDHLVAPTYNPNQQDDYRGYELYGSVRGSEEDYTDYTSSQGSYSEQHGNKEEYNSDDNYSDVAASEGHGDASFESTNSLDKREEKHSQYFKSSY